MSGGALVVRRALPGDADGWIAIVQEAAAEEPPLIVTRAEEVWSADAFAEKTRTLDQGEEALLVAQRDPEVVGVLGMRRGARVASRHTAELGITVRRFARGRGVGRALMVEAERIAREWGVRKLCLGVFAHNERALRLYRGLGYEEEGIRRGQYLFPSGPVDEVLMAKRVGE